MSRSDWYISDAFGRALAALAAGGSPAADLLAQSEMSRLAYRHGLVVPVARALGPGEPRGRYLGAVAARMAARHAVIDRQLGEILTALADREVRASVVKGPAVARLYDDPSVRTYTDVDVVVPAEELDAALEVLRDHRSIGAIPAKVPAADKRDIVVRDPSGVQFTVDLHWDLFSFHQLQGSADQAMTQAWREATFQPDHALGPMWLLPEEVVTSFLCLHAVLDHRFRLILFRDLMELAEHQPDWDRMGAFADSHGLSSLQYLAWLIASQATGAKVPGPFLNRLSKGSWPERLAERFLARADLVRFAGHRVHPLNLAITQVHDDPVRRRRMLIRAPFAYPGWRKRVQRGPENDAYSVDILVTSDARRGAEVFGRTLADELVLRGWDATLVSLRGGESPGVATTPVTELVGSLRGLRLPVWGGLRRRLRTHRPAVVFANGGATLRYAAAASLSLRQRPRLIYGSIGEPGFWLRGPFHRWWQRRLISACHHVTAVSEATGRALVDRLAVPAEKVSVIPLGVDEPWFTLPSRADREGPLRVLFAGSFSFEKDPLTAIRAAARLQGQAVVRMVGEGPLRSALEDAAGPNVEIVGAVEDMAEQMEWADVLLLTSLTEGLPGVAVEASASGLPVVASAVGGTGEIVVPGETGLLVDPGDVDDFEAALRKLAEDPDLRERLGNAARRRVRERFRLEETVALYEDLFRRATHK